MRKIREALRLSHEGLSTRVMASSLGIGRTTLREYLSRARDAGLSWPLPSEHTDADLEQLLFPRRSTGSSDPIPLPDWGYRRHNRTHIFDVQSLSHRPVSVTECVEFGHWECDLMMFRKEHGKVNVTSLVERVSRYAVVMRNEDRTSKPIMEALIQGLAPLLSLGSGKTLGN